MTKIVNQKGTPIDAFDQACKEWQQCTSCNEMGMSQNL